MQSQLGKKEETKCEWAARDFLVLGPFSRRFSDLFVSCYNIPLIKFEVTCTGNVNTKSEKKNRNLHHSKQVSENDINDLTPQNEKTTFYFKQKEQVLAFGNNNLK